MMQRLEREIIHGGLKLLITADFCTTKGAVIFLFLASIVLVRQCVSDVNWVILCVFQLMQINESIHPRSRCLYCIPYTRKDKNSLLFNNGQILVFHFDLAFKSKASIVKPKMKFL